MVNSTINPLTLMLLVAILANTKWCKKSWKLTETLVHGYSSKRTQWELSNEYQHDTQKSLRHCRWTKEAWALEGLMHVAPKMPNRVVITPWQKYILECIWRNVSQNFTYSSSSYIMWIYCSPFMLILQIIKRTYHWLSGEVGTRVGQRGSSNE